MPFTPESKEIARTLWPIAVSAGVNISRAVPLSIRVGPSIVTCRLAAIIDRRKMAGALFDLGPHRSVVEDFPFPHQRRSRRSDAHGVHGIDEAGAGIEIGAIKQAGKRDRNEIGIAEPALAVGIGK